MTDNVIFICDDEQDILRYLERLFHIQGMKVETYSCGEALLNRLQDNLAPSPRLLLQDIQVGIENGFEIAREARKIHQDLPVILMSGYHSADTEDLAVEAGAQGFLAKPFPKEKLLEMVAKL